MPDLIAFCDKMSGFVDEEGAVAVLYLAFSQAFIKSVFPTALLLLLVGMPRSQWLGSQVGKQLLVGSGSEGD